MGYFQGTNSDLTFAAAFPFRVASILRTWLPRLWAGLPGLCGRRITADRLKDLDRNDDGQITRDEVYEQLRKRVFERFDKNEHDVIDESEASPSAARLTGDAAPQPDTVTVSSGPASGSD
jgi:hypothetical protein